MYKVPGPFGLVFGGPSDLPAEGSRVSCCEIGYHDASFSFISKLSASHLYRPPWPAPSALDLAAAFLVLFVSRFLFACDLPLLRYWASMAMTPTANNADAYVPSINCLPGDDAADVVTPFVSAAALAPDEVPAVLLAVEPALLVLVLVLVLVLGFFTTLVAKPGDESVLSPACSIIASDSNKKNQETYQSASGRYRRRYTHSSGKRPRETMRPSQLRGRRYCSCRHRYRTGLTASP